MVKLKSILFAGPVLLLTGLTASAQAYRNSEPLAHTFSIVAIDEKTGEMAAAVQSHWFSVGTIVIWGRSGVGVVATQSFVNPAYGPEGLELMQDGITAGEALETLVAKDEGRNFRQVAFLDSQGNVSAYTGENCIRSAGHLTGSGYSVQANMMLNDMVVPAMAEAFEKNSSLPLAERMVEVLKSAQEAGGDIRGRQSAALIVVHPEKGVEPWSDRSVDLRVDDSNEPIAELERLLKVHRAYEHMNNGDLAIEKGDMSLALKEYGAAEQMFPGNLEMRYWKAVALANNGLVGQSLPLFESIFKEDPNWRELTSRLPEAGLLTVSEDDLKLIISR
jgi:uncharacterized Ntn-hydrolase superfamily protein